MILKNTKQMVNALENNKDKFKIIKKLSQKITDAKCERAKIINVEVKKIYDIAFKNLSSKRTEVEFTQNSKYGKGNDVYFICNTGISKKANNSYSINAENIGRIDSYNSNSNQFAEQLHIIGTNQATFLKALSKASANKQKKDVFRKFMKDISLLKKNPNSLIRFNEDNIPVINEYIGISDNDFDNDFEIKQKEVRGLALLRENIEIGMICDETQIQKSYVGNFEQHRFGETQITTNRQGLQDFLLIEQLYTPIKKLLETELRLRLKELENTKKYFNYLTDTFSSYLMFNELKKTN